MSVRLKKDIAKLMADRRPRTTNDIAVKVCVPKRRGMLTKVLREMKSMGLLRCCKKEQEAIWENAL